MIDWISEIIKPHEVEERLNTFRNLIVAESLKIVPVDSRIQITFLMNRSFDSYTELNNFLEEPEDGDM